MSNEGLLREELYTLRGGDMSTAEYWDLSASQARGTVVTDVKLCKKPFHEGVWQALLPCVEICSVRFGRGSVLYVSRRNP